MSAVSQRVRSKDLNIDVHHLARVEGHGNIKVSVRDGVLEEVKFEIPESPRFFEAMLRGRSYAEASHITSRVCGICAVGHATTSLKATEAALGVQPSEQTVLLRKVIFDGEMIESHVLHVYFLAAPDALGVGSVIPLATTHPEVVKRALRLKKLGNDLSGVLVGRKIHPISMIVNGFTHLPTVRELRELRQRLLDAIPDLQASVELFQTLRLPEFERETEYLALRCSDGYAFYDGDIVSTDGGVTPVSQYRTVVREKVVPHSTAKHCWSSRGSYMVGALARFNNNSAQLRPLASKAAEDLGLKAPCYNPFLNTVAQLVETVEAVEDGIESIDKLLERGIGEEDTRVEVRAGLGAGATEVPRGTLYHEYELDAKGLIVGANLIIPTGQNMANIEADMRALVPTLLDRPKPEIELTLEMLVRAYDPCISCSVHLVEL